MCLLIINYFLGLQQLHWDQHKSPLVNHESKHCYCLKLIPHSLLFFWIGLDWFELNPNYRIELRWIELNFLPPKIFPLFSFIFPSLHFLVWKMDFWNCSSSNRFHQQIIFPTHMPTTVTNYFFLQCGLYPCNMHPIVHP